MMLSTTSGKDSTGGRYSIREGQNSASGGLRRFAAGSWRMDRRIRAASFPVAHENVSYGSFAEIVGSPRHLSARPAIRLRADSRQESTKDFQKLSNRPNVPRQMNGAA